MNLSELSYRSNECYIDLNGTEHCIFFLVYLQNLSINVCIQFYNFHILCLHFYFLVVSFKVWYHYVTAHVKFSLFVFCTLIYVHVILLVTHCKAKLIAHLRCICFDIFPFCVILIQFWRIFPNCEKGKCLQFSHQPIGYVLAQLFFM